MIFSELLPVVAELHLNRSDLGGNKLTVKRQGVMYHYDDSTTDKGGVAWFKHPDALGYYNRAYGDDAQITSVADDDWKAPHAGICLVPDANSFFFGQCALTNGKTLATPDQLAAMMEDTIRLFRKVGWPGDEVARRLFGHDEQAVYSKRKYPNRPDLWGKLGRKQDPTGTRQDGVKVIDMDKVRSYVKKELAIRVFLPPAPVPLPSVVIKPKRPTLMLGMGGKSDPKNMPHVKYLQKKLGMSVASQTGYFGPLTLAAVKTFQRRHGLKPDGVVGTKETWPALEMHHV